jgi:transporter family-2 protein
LKSAIILGVAGAMATGVAIGVQATLSSRIGALIGHVRTGLLTNFVGGIVAGGIVLILVVRQGAGAWRVPAAPAVMLLLSGTLGLLIVTGVAFSFQRTGVAAGVATLILGQLAVSVIVDTKGIGDVVPIPLTWQRLFGLLVMGLAVYLLLPRK